MKKGSAHGSSFLHRWLSRTSNPTSTYDGHSDAETDSTTPFSPPPLTDSSSTTVSSALLTPRTSVRYPPIAPKSRNVSGIQPCTPPTRYTTLPAVTTSRADSLPFKHQPSPQALTVVRTEVKLHRLLSYDPMCRPLKFDITLPTTFILQYPSTSQSAMVVRSQLFQPRPVTSSKPMTSHELSQLATTPPISCLRIITDLIPWSIIVRGRTTLADDPNSFVRVVDILDGIYKSLRVGVSNDEWSRVPKPFRNQVKKAYSSRCQASLPFTLHGYEQKQGIRRVDYLKDKTMFLGLTTKTLDKGDTDSSRNVEATFTMMLAPHTSLAQLIP